MLSDAPAARGASRVWTLPGVWPPSTDAHLLAQLVSERRLAAGADVLDVFTGSGVLAVSAALAGAHSVTATDLSRRALLSVQLNARRHGVRVRTLRGDLFAPVSAARFDLILANPPYFPGPPELPTRGAARAWEGGRDGRVLVDRVCAEAHRHLRPGGRAVVVQNSMIGEGETLRRLEATGLQTEVLLRHRGPLGPVGRASAALLRQRDAAGPPEDEEEILLISGTVPGR